MVKKILCLVVVLLSAGSMHATGIVLDELLYTVVSYADKTVAVSKCNAVEYTSSIVVPQTVLIGGETYAVVSVAQNGFSGTMLTSITLPVTLTTIESNAFQNCINLKSISFSGVKTIGQSAFNGCIGLSSITLPSTLSRIDVWAFQGCENLKTITCEGTEATGIPDCAGTVVFAGVPENVVVKVPSGELLTYRRDAVWKLFANLTDGSSVPVAEVNLNYEEYELTEGGSFVLIATVKPEDAVSLTGTWSSSDQAIATVDSKGNVKAVAAGVAIITFTATGGGKTATCRVTVNEEDDIETSNEFVSENMIYLSGNILYVKSPSVNDLVHVYTASGLCIDKFVKSTELLVKDISAYPSGMLIITNGKDWTKKVVR